MHRWLPRPVGGSPVACSLARWVRAPSATPDRWAIGSLGGSAATGDLITQSVTRGTFVHDITERGELESSNNISVRCEVQARGQGVHGVKIIDIVAEGAVVKEGDFLIKFDDSALLTDAPRS